MGLIILALDRTALVVDETCSAAQRRGSTGRALHVESTGKCDHFLVQCRRAYVKIFYENIRNLCYNVIINVANARFNFQTVLLC